MNGSRILIAATLVFSMGSTAFADNIVKLKFGSHLPANHPGVTEDAAIFMKTAKELSNNTIDFDFYPAQQAGKANQMFDLVKAGAVDLGAISSSVVSTDKLPIMGLWDVPGLVKDTCSIVKAMLVLGAPGGDVYEKGFKPNGVRALGYEPFPPFGLQSRVPIKSIDDLKGLKIRAAGGFTELAVQKLGGVPVKMAAPEVFQSLQRGTVDASIFAFLSSKSYDLPSIARYGATGFGFSTGGNLLMISERKFQSLSADQQKALIEAGKKASENWCKYADQTESKDIEEMRANGLDIHTWTPDEVAKLKSTLADLPTEWAKSLDARGLSGSLVLEKYIQAVK